MKSRTVIGKGHLETALKFKGCRMCIRDRYDFSATHPDDLALKEGDVVQLVKKVNDDWLEGRIGNRQGMFPLSFIDIKVPLPEST
ncbi:SH3 domain-containing protein 19 [Temnothorax longispinosus]|uniref:SH3 domain-containing protein 19 n=1 Tax=Temnothorax longispinosus TaxID=300112 RepID=A0A4S2KHS4_9HYME|nr:SH3 domain-containing protein 19 [Temnothorax longispinosus]